MRFYADPKWSWFLTDIFMETLVTTLIKTVEKAPPLKNLWYYLMVRAILKRFVTTNETRSSQLSAWIEQFLGLKVDHQYSTNIVISLWCVSLNV